MEIIPKSGIGKLLFGMKEKDVNALYGNPDRIYSDDEENVIWQYNALRLRLTFYEDEDFKLGYIITSNPEATIFGTAVIDKNVETVKASLLAKGFAKWEKEDIDMTENHFNEDFWTILLAEFGVVIKVELGATIVRDEFVWKF